MTVDEALRVGYSWGMYQHKKEIHALTELLFERQVKTVVEIGVHRGGTAALWCSIVGKDGLVVGVDLPDGRWGGIGVPAAEERDHLLSQTFPYYWPIRGDSHEQSTIDRVQAALGGRSVDFLFIDGDHSFEGVNADYQNFAFLVKPGGLIGFHDISHCERHTKDGVEVPRWWDNAKALFKTRQFEDHQGWGGIGVIEV